MRAQDRIVALVALLGVATLGPACKRSEGAQVRLVGAGASFPDPLYQKWFIDYTAAHPDVVVDYQAIGSGAGVSRFTEGLVDFGASDAAMSDKEMAAVKRGVRLLPMTAGSIVVAYNLPEVEELRLSRVALVGIFSGTIERWNDPKIQEANPGVSLPDESITVVRRADGSGTTFVFTGHLTAISPEFGNTVGHGKSVNWPDKAVGMKRNDGVAAALHQTRGSIGYLEYGFAKKTSPPLSTAKLENKAGRYVEATLHSAQAALESVELPDNLRAFVTDPAGDEAYPIVTFSWILAYESYEEPEKLVALKAVLTYGLTDGQADADPLGYVPLPHSVRERVLAALGGLKP